MQILVVNPNTTASMTAGIAAAARAAAAAGTTIRSVNPSDGPASIEGYVDEAYCVPGLLGEIRRAQARPPAPDAVVIACFDDTGLDAARCVASGPVVGIGEAAFHMASLLAGRFGVVTTLARSIAAIEHNLVRYGFASRCCGVRASEVPVLSLEDPASDARERISAEIARAIEHDRAEAIVLGCAGMADLAGALSQRHGVPVLDGVACAVRLAESLVVLGLSTSRIGAYAPPIPKRYDGIFADAAPVQPSRP
ncbi:MAG: aspartate/glutamate racemase family protein [Lautropia sp.]